MIGYLRASALATLALAPGPAFASDAPKARNVILMISDGCGFNGWLAADYYEGRAGTQPYQVARPDGTRPHVAASAFPMTPRPRPAWRSIPMCPTWPR